MGHDVFVCYSSEDKTIADAACAKLEGAGIRCWIAPRDPIPGIPYGGQLVDAIGATRILLLIFSGNANRSEHVLRELEIASDGSKIIVPFRIENVIPSGDLRYYITRVHWLDAMSPPMESRLNELVTLMQRLLELPLVAPAVIATPVSARRKLSPIAIGALAAVVAAAVAAGATGFYRNYSRPPVTHVSAKPTVHPKRVATKATPKHVATVFAHPSIAAQPTPRLIYVAAPLPPPIAVPAAARARKKPVTRATARPTHVVATLAKTPSPAPIVPAFARPIRPGPMRPGPMRPGPQIALAGQSAPVPWRGITNYPPNWQIGGCTIQSQTLNFFTIPGGPYAGMMRLISRLTLSGTGCALRLSYAVYSADHTLLGTLTEAYNATGLQRRAQIGNGGSNFEFDRARFGSAAYIVRSAVP
jgi:hypothetical protein